MFRRPQSTGADISAAPIKWTLLCARVTQGRKNLRLAQHKEVIVKEVAGLRRRRSTYSNSMFFFNQLLNNNKNIVQNKLQAQLDVQRRNSTTGGTEIGEETIPDQTCLEPLNQRENNTRSAKPWRRNCNIALDALRGGNLRALVSVLARLLLINSKPPFCTSQLSSYPEPQAQCSLTNLSSWLSLLLSWWEWMSMLT